MNKTKRFTKKDFAALPRSEQVMRNTAISALWAHYIASGDGSLDNNEFGDITARYKKLAKAIYSGKTPPCKLCNGHGQVVEVDGVKGARFAYFKGYILCEPCCKKHENFWDEVNDLYENGGFEE